MFSGKRSVNLGREVISEHKEKLPKKKQKAFKQIPLVVFMKISPSESK